MIILPFLLVILSSYVVTDECLSASLSPGGQALMAETSDVVRVETSDSEAECEVRLERRAASALLRRSEGEGQLRRATLSQRSAPCDG